MKVVCLFLIACFVSFAASIDGSAVNSITGGPVAGVTVTVSRQSSDVYSAITDSHGKFLIEDTSELGEDEDVAQVIDKVEEEER